MGLTYQMGFNDWITRISGTSSNFITSLRTGKDLYDKWYKFTYGLSPAQIAALPELTGITVADVTTISYGLSVFNDIYTALYNLGALTQADREGYMVPFI